MNIEALLIEAGERYPAWLTGLLLGGAALSFLARHRAQYKYGRIREYNPTALGIAGVVGALAVFYVLIQTGAASLPERPIVVRVLLSLLSVATVAFNWGGVRVAWRDVREVLREHL
jgi:hypothetical protein